ncbi:radical SAM family heme chaperone HemW [Limibaculum sp. FT325]|uniref:radical SAM family heme chaperone HemW n=1 Tax=Thermohalobaculum sediminis TaxID=2939436 RepID=UPI0020BE057F|nr:radical SAM family heme chaperone HemW [Limibaculum sediminis]MCL5776716.1 radical SAM family heme chaperone HemW [Limibaculum sediminis]
MTAPDWRAGGFGVYVHWPFCLAKCPYCDFNSHVSRVVDHAAWAESLVAEMRRMRELTGPRRADTMFFGGGTPSLMAPETVARLIDEADRLWGLAPGAEITLEANPTSVEAAKFRAYGAAGINRVSMGVQALNDADLKALGRMHTVSEARAAFDVARAAFRRVSFDLIYARMGQTPAAWEAELGAALAMAVDHLSLYQLTIEEGTRFFDLHRRGRLVVPPDEASAEMYAITQELTEAAGMPAYEVSNHAAPGAESRHNLVYWRSGDYAGLGPGAHGRITREDGVRLATATARDPAGWMAQVADRGHALVEETPLSPAEHGDEMVLMGLRLAEGIGLARHAAVAGAPIAPERIAALEGAGLVSRRAGRLVATPEGRLVLDRVLAELLA